MKLECINCGQDFDAATVRGYCDECIELWNKQREHIHKRQHPEDGVQACGKFATGCPVSVTDPVTERQVCGFCGSPEIETGYGLGSGYGIGSYNFCTDCNTFLDFHEDTGE